MALRRVGHMARHRMGFQPEISWLVALLPQACLADHVHTRSNGPQNNNKGTTAMTTGMRWRIFVLQVGLIGILAFVSGFAFWASSFATSTVHDQLAAQQIYFPAAGSTAITSLPKVDATAMTQYAGQELLTGQQAQVYANNFINVHLGEIGGGKTYSQLSAASQADPTNTNSRRPGPDRLPWRHAAQHPAQHLRLVADRTVRRLRGDRPPRGRDRGARRLHLRDRALAPDGDRGPDLPPSDAVGDGRASRVNQSASGLGPL